MYRRTLDKHIHFTKKGEFTYLKNENTILCSEDLARELIPKHFLSNFPYKDEWFETLSEILEKENYAYFRRIAIQVGDTVIETDILKIDIRPEFIEEVPDHVQEEIFQTLINNLKEGNHASSSY